MLHDFDLIAHNFPGEIVVYPIADAHLGAIEHCEPEWQAFLKRVESENAYLILAGDLLNNAVKSASFSNPFEEAIRPRDAKRRMTEYLAPIKNRILCVTTGNHERRTFRDDDQDLTYDICTKLDIEHLYRENVCFMSVSIGTRTNYEKPEATYTFAVTHGTGGGIYTGAAVNRNERFGNIIDGLDCLVVGHVHKGFITKPSKVIIDSRNGTVKMKHYVVVSCVSWLNYSGYAAQKMLLPAYACDPQKLKLICDRRNKKIITTW